MEEKLYKMIEVANELGVSKIAVYYKVKADKLGTTEIINGKKTILLSKRDIKSLHFRKPNKKKYVRNKHKHQ